MPSFIPANRRQLPTRDANLTRLRTKIRWIVEAINGRLKQWRFLANVICNHYIPYIGDFFNIVGALINK